MIQASPNRSGLRQFFKTRASIGSKIKIRQGFGRVCVNLTCVTWPDPTQPNLTQIQYLFCLNTLKISYNHNGLGRVWAYANSKLSELVLLKKDPHWVGFGSVLLIGWLGLAKPTPNPTRCEVLFLQQLFLNRVAILMVRSYNYVPSFSVV